MKKNKSINFSEEKKNLFLDVIDKEYGEKIDKCVKECIDGFNFEEVAKIFSIMNYKYASLDKTNSYIFKEYIPNASYLKNECVKSLYRNFARMIIEETDQFSSESGRMKVTTYIIEDEGIKHFVARIDFIPVTYDNNYY